MKIYTEEQVIQILYWMSPIYMGREQVEERIKKELTPIELPSDEEIREYINSTPYYGHCTPEYCEGIEDGIKWILTKIQGDNQ